MLACVSPKGKIERIRQLVKGPEVKLLGRLQFLERSQFSLIFECLTTHLRDVWFRRELQPVYL